MHKRGATPAMTAHGLRLAGGLLAALLLAACGSKQDVIEPVELPDYKPAVNIERLWVRRIGDGAEDFGLRLAPAVTGKAVFAVDGAGLVMALDHASGRTLWKQHTGKRFGAGPVAGYNQVFIGTRKGELLALSAEDGATQWSAQLTGELLAPPALDADIVVVKAGDGRIAAYERATGTLRWDYEAALPALTLRAASRPLLFADAVVTGLPSGMLLALARDNGRQLWERRLAEPSGKSELDRLVDAAGDAVVHQGRLYAATYQGRLVAIDLGNGSFAWQQPASSYRALAATGDTVYMVDTDSRVVAYRADDGVRLWTSEVLLGRQLTGITVLGDWLLAGDFEGWLHVLGRADGAVLGRQWVDGDGVATEPVVDEGLVYVQGKGGRVAALRITARDPNAVHDVWAEM